MRRRTLLPALWLAAALLPFAGCEDTDVTAPTDGQILISANPAEVVIDTEAGETSGRSTIVAQVFDANGFAIQGVNVTFSSTGGTLLSSDNACQSNGFCRLTGGACSTDSDCPAVPPATLETDSNGVVTDVLTLTTSDASSVEVTARSATVTASVTLSKTVAEGNLQPSAIVAASPEDRQAVDKPATFDGRGSSDPDGAITCYQWTIDSSLEANDEVIQNQSQTLITRRYADEQSLTVSLRVSDQSDAASFCVPYEGPPGSGVIAPAERFSPDTDTVAYEIVCDTSAPQVDGGPDRSLTLDAGLATVNLTAIASDADSDITSYRWSCGNEQDDVLQSTVNCVYTFADVFTARITVTNECGLTATDEVQITVNPGT